MGTSGLVARIPWQQADIRRKLQIDYTTTNTVNKIAFLREGGPPTNTIQTHVGAADQKFEVCTRRSRLHATRGYTHPHIETCIGLIINALTY